MASIHQVDFITECAGLMLKRAALILLTFCFGCLFFLSGCGKNDEREQAKSRKYVIAVDNQSSDPVKLRFDAYYNGYCQRGHAKEVIPSKTSRVFEIVFQGCMNSGGERIDGVVYEFNPIPGSAKVTGEKLDGQVFNGAKIICIEAKCNVLTR